VNPLDWGIIGTGVLAFIFSFVDFYSGVSGSVGGRHVSTGAGSWTAWHTIFGGGFFAWFAMLFAVVAAILLAVQMFQPQVSLRVPARVAGVILFAVATVFEIIAIFVTPGIEAPLGVDADVSVDHGVGFWISLIVIVVGAVLSLMRAQQTNTALPGPLSNIPKIGS